MHQLNNLKKYTVLYEELYAIAETQIKTLFYENDFFSGTHEQELNHIKAKHKPEKPGFMDVLHKYYLLTTLGLHRFSFRHFFKTIFLVIIINLRYKKFKEVVSFYNDIINREINSLEKLVPEIDLIGKKHQIVKFILANVLTTFIYSNLLFPRKVQFKLEKSFYMGFYIGVNYMFSDYILDSLEYTKKDKLELHNLLITILSDGDYSHLSNCRFYAFMDKIITDCKLRFPFKENEEFYKILFLLEQTQFDDLCFNYKKGQTDKLINKSSLVALKTLFSLVAVNLKLGKNLGDKINKSILWTLYCQMTDDIRDINDDRDNNILTLLTLEEDQHKFNPYKLYIFLSNKFAKKYYAPWMYSDLLNILNDVETHSEIKHDDRKINVFTNKILGLKFA